MDADAELDALLSLPIIDRAAVSPDGRHVAWTWLRAGPTADVFVAPTDGSAAPVALTRSDQNSRLAGWDPRGGRVLVAQDEDGDERYRLFAVRLDAPGEMLALTERPAFFPHAPTLHPDGRSLLYAGNHDEDGSLIEASWPWRLDLLTGRRRALARPRRSPWAPELELSPDGRWVLYGRSERQPGGRQVWRVGADGRGDRPLVDPGATAKAFAGFLPDSRRAWVLAEHPRHRALGVLPVDADGPDGAIRWLVDDPARDLHAVHAPRRAGGALVLLESRTARLRASLVDPDTGAERPFPTPPGTLLPLDRAADGAWIGRRFHARLPDDLVRFDPADRELLRARSLSRVWERTPLRENDLAAAEDLRWRSVDGLEIQGWLYRPAGRPRGVVVHVHGGPTAHAADRILALVQYLVRRGFAVLEPNYRGSTGFGLPFREAIKAEGWGGLEQHDIRTGIEKLLEMGVAVPGRIGVTGTSYGGYSAWCQITRYAPELVAAAAPICGMTDLVVDYESTRPDLRSYAEEMMGGSPGHLPERYRERSPVHDVHRIRGRLLIVQGERDPNVTPANVRAVRAALQAAGVPYEMLAFEDEGHGIVRPENQRRLYRRLADFFEAAFRDAPA